MVTTPGDTEKMSLDECRQYIFDQIYMPVILDGFSAAGIRSKTDMQVQQLVEKARILRKNFDANRAKAAMNDLLILPGDSRIDAALSQSILAHLTKDNAAWETMKAVGGSYHHSNGCQR